MNAHPKSDSDIALIELVDSEILGFNPAGKIIREPGYALLEKQSITTGDSAFSQSWLYPQRCFNKFWHQLNLAPLPATNNHARHYADLAYAQLSHIYQALDTPEELIFALPGNFSSDQLSILLGLANALPVTTIGMVDAAVAVASTLDHHGDLLYLDLQLHQAVITHVNVTKSVARVAVEIIPDAGLKNFYGVIGHYLANLFIKEYRYDPLHTAEGEQQLFGKLPVWLKKLNNRDETTIELSTPQGNLRLNIFTRSLLEQASPRIKKMTDILEKFPRNATRFSSYRWQKLPGITAQLKAISVDENQVKNGCYRAMDILQQQKNDLAFITELPLFGKEPSYSDTINKLKNHSHNRPTHLLYNHRAYALNNGLGIKRLPDGLSISNLHSSPLWISEENNTINLNGNCENLHIEGDKENLKSGDKILIDQYTAIFIEVDTVS